MDANWLQVTMDQVRAHVQSLFEMISSPHFRLKRDEMGDTVPSCFAASTDDMADYLIPRVGTRTTLSVCISADGRALRPGIAIQIRRLTFTHKCVLS
jgi:hypothetical protein